MPIVRARTYRLKYAAQSSALTGMRKNGHIRGQRAYSCGDCSRRYLPDVAYCRPSTAFRERAIGRSKIRYKTVRGYKSRRYDELAKADTVGMEWRGRAVGGRVGERIARHNRTCENTHSQTLFKIPHRSWDGYVSRALLY